jgi:hypothetical protein
MTSMAATAWWVMHASGPMELVGAYVVVCLAATATSLLFMCVREADEPMRALSLTAGDVARGVVLGAVLAGVLVTAAWRVTGLKGVYFLAPVVGPSFGAWLTSRGIAPFGGK